MANCAWYGEGGGGGEARVEFKINDYKLSRSPCAKTLVCTASRAFHHRFGIWCIVSCSGEGEGEKKGEWKKKRKKKKQQIDTIPAVESLLFEGVSVSRANEIQEI